MKITRWKNNPILADAGKLPWCSGGVRNPGAVMDNGKIRMLFTANAYDNSGTREKMRLGYAESEDGFNFECRQDPVLNPSDEGTFFDWNGIDDPRITKIDDTFYFTYASPSAFPDIPLDSASNQRPGWLLGLRRTGLAKTSDWQHIERLGPITHPLMADANAVLFPEKIGGQYAMLHRPTPYIPWGVNHYYFPGAIFLAFSDSLTKWGWDKDWDKIAAKSGKYTISELIGDDHLLIRPEFEWERLKVGASGVPIPTDDGWLMLYHAVDVHKSYRVGLMLLDRENPLKVIARSEIPIFESEAEYELQGYYPSCVFPCANVVIGDEVFIYYGAADSCCAVATVKLKDMLEYILSCRK